MSLSGKWNWADEDLKIDTMGKLRFRNENREWVEMEIPKHQRIEVTDNDDNRYEIRPDKFGGIEILASDGSISVNPRMANQIIVETRQ